MRITSTLLLGVLLSLSACDKDKANDVNAGGPDVVANADATVSGDACNPCQDVSAVTASGETTPSTGVSPDASQSSAGDGK